jgi:hypothetical protein
MRRPHLLSFLALALCAACSSVPAAKSPALDPVQQDVKRINEALYAGDVATVIHYTHPAIVKSIGGEEKARKLLQEFYEKSIVPTEMKLESLKFPSKPEYLESGGRRFAVVPTLAVYSLKEGQRVESKNFEVGLLDVGATEWRYVEGLRVTKQNLQALFPGFPEDYKFPETYRKKL